MSGRAPRYAADDDVSVSGASNRVVLNVYDLSSDLAAGNWYAYWCGVGVFHAGVEVYGVEYAYGGHDADVSGIFATEPRDAPGQAVYRESVDMGCTDLTPEEVHQLVLALGRDWYKGNRYHLLQRNCNHFASDLCKHLVGAPAPSWINRLAELAISLHCLLPQSLVPQLQPPTVTPAFEERQGLLTLAPGSRSEAPGHSPSQAQAVRG